MDVSLSKILDRWERVSIRHRRMKISLYKRFLLQYRILWSIALGWFCSYGLSLGIIYLMRMN